MGDGGGPSRIYCDRGCFACYCNTQNLSRIFFPSTYTISSNFTSISTAPISIFENANHFLPRSLREAPK